MYVYDTPFMSEGAFRCTKVPQVWDSADKRGRNVKLTTHLHFVPWLIKSAWSYTSPPPTPPWRGTPLRTGIRLPF